jgi:uncharacterized protein YkwD
MHKRAWLKLPSALFSVIWLGTIGMLTQAHSVENMDYLSPLEKKIVQEMNFARSNPAEYASFLNALKQHYDGKLLKKPGKIPLVTQEGVGAVDEALDFLRSADQLPPLSPSRGMSMGARDHVEDQGPKGLIGHQGSDGSDAGDRVNRYGAWEKQVGENISYGGDDAREIVMGFIIDDGVPERGHRKNLFNPNYHVVGVACGPHAVYHTMCVITFAGGYTEKRKD